MQAGLNGLIVYGEHALSMFQHRRRAALKILNFVRSQARIDDDRGAASAEEAQIIVLDHAVEADAEGVGSGRDDLSLRRHPGDLCGQIEIANVLPARGERPFAGDGGAHQERQGKRCRSEPSRSRP